ncbi:hypothetical protein KPH14_002180 [Odynerus spinipes]|uniref:dolichol kinase n=1 Tax=Odynerus spinipes TaxID=1348599 RepID=A0AAD9RM32_9HYME|nr:hypothetical protein KPH14_002180 [Odynerus spinipes]
MEMVFTIYENIERKVLENLKKNNIKHRSKASSGLWLGSLIGIGAALTLLREDNSYSEICFIVGLTGFGLIVSCSCLYVRLFIGKNAIKDFHAIYFLPSIIASMLFLLVANKGLLTSVTWGLSVGSLGTWGVLQLMSNFPGCFTIGEATTVTHGSILFLLSAMTNIPLRYHLPPIHDEDIATIILQIGILYVLSIGGLCKNFPILHSARCFYTLVFCIFLLLVVPLLQVLLDQNPITWMLFYIFGTQRRVALMIYWAMCLLLSIFVITFQVLSSTRATTSIRKYFHILAVLVYIPGILFEPTLLYLSSGVIMGIFCVVELTRILKVSPLGDILQRGFAILVDDKDNLISLTPLYLLCGLSLPLWMPANNVSTLVLFSGVLTVGIGDTAASFVGSKWGKHKWPGLDKSMEGTLACIISQLGVIFILAYTRYIDDQLLLLRSIPSVIVVSFVEAKTDQIDNLALPLLMT